MPRHKPEVTGPGEVFLPFISLADCQAEYGCGTVAATETAANW
jgi:hypothetical protein